MNHPRSSPQALTTCAAVATAVFTVVLVRTAWMSDDAYITLRTIDNLVNGHGLRWNIAERVQAFTHPAWLLLLTPVYAVTREPYFTTLAVQGLLALTTMFLLTRVVARTLPQAAFAAAIMVSSKAMTDFSTSGLENPLTHLALLGVFVSWRAGRRQWLWLLASLAVLTRQDLVLLLLPVLVAASRHVTPAAMRGQAWQPPWRPALTAIVTLTAWHVFAFVYYGTLVPNTAMAKLATGIPTADLLQQGLNYWTATFRFDPLTIIAMAAGALVLLFVHGRSGAIMTIGAALYAAYLLRAGGDFMSGRFFTPMLFWILLGLVGLPGPGRMVARAVSFAPAAIALAIGLLAVPSPPLRSGSRFGADAPDGDPVEHYGVTDERRFYYPRMGLLPRLGVTKEWREMPWIETGKSVRARTTELQVIAANNVGMFGYYAGPGVHVVDRNALCDPLLARLPARRPWRIGHYTRDLPAGYLDGLRTGSNGLVDPRLREFYDRIRIVTQGPIWGLTRFRHAIALIGARVRP